MITVYNIRGTNGSGKSTLARAFIGGDPAAPPNRYGDENSPNMVDLAHYPSPTTREPGRMKFVDGYVSSQEPALQSTVLVVGPYRTACGGLDAVPSFDLAFAAIRKGIDILETIDSGHKAIIAEGVISSTVWGSWGAFADEIRPKQHAEFAFCYLDTPLEVCLDRIRDRQRAAGKERAIKEELVMDKIKAVAATRTKAIEAGHLVYDLPWQKAEMALGAIITNAAVFCPLALTQLEKPAREVYRARA